ncbi:hypothetical protein AAXE64_27670 [Priestia megaterium]
MKVYVLLEHSHHEIMNADKAFVRAEQVKEYLKTASGTYCEDEIELVLPEENINTVEEILDTFESLMSRIFRIDLILNNLTEADSNYKEYMDEKKEIEKQIVDFKKQRVLNLKEVDEQ